MRKHDLEMPEPDAPQLKSVNVFMTRSTREILDAQPQDNRSRAVRRFASILITAHDAGNPRIVPEVLRIVTLTNPTLRREMRREAGVEWVKAIIWLPTDMIASIDRIFGARSVTSSEFLRAAVIMAVKPEELSPYIPFS